MAEIITITTAGITIITFTDDRIAEIIIDPAATPEHVLDAVDLARLLLAHGITVAKIVKRPGINAAHQGELQTKHKSETTKIAIPAGIVTASELTQVLRVLGLIQSSPKEN